MKMCTSAFPKQSVFGPHYIYENVYFSGFSYTSNTTFRLVADIFAQIAESSYVRKVFFSINIGQTKNRLFWTIL